jgi:hypothetical protein
VSTWRGSIQKNQADIHCLWVHARSLVSKAVELHGTPDPSTVSRAIKSYSDYARELEAFSKDIQNEEIKNEFEQIIISLREIATELCLSKSDIENIKKGMESTDFKTSNIIKKFDSLFEKMRSISEFWRPESSLEPDFIKNIGGRPKPDRFDLLDLD